MTLQKYYLFNNIEISNLYNYKKVYKLNAWKYIIETLSCKANSYYYFFKYE